MVELSVKFPDGFLWGAATSAFQVEGGGISPEPKSDWREWEKRVLPAKNRSDRSADQYNFFRGDFALARSLGHNTHRLGLEWARIEPEQGVFDPEGIKHYQEVLGSLRDNGLKIVLTLNHFTNPLWFAKLGGWENPESSILFKRFVEVAADKLGGYVDYWVTINEPLVYTNFGYLGAKFPPQKQNLPSALRVFLNMARAHKRAYAALHREISQSQVGIANNISNFESYHKNPPLYQPEAKVAAIINALSRHLFYILTPRTHDFLGVNYYMSYAMKLKSELPFITAEFAGDEKNYLGWGVYPKGLREILVRLKRYKKPIIITENGIATNDDAQRERFFISHLLEIYGAISEGAPVIGYLHWSFLKCMELHLGYDPDFGLVNVELDSPAKTRMPRPSAYLFKEIIENNGIPQAILKKYTP